MKESGDVERVLATLHRYHAMTPAGRELMDTLVAHRWAKYDSIRDDYALNYFFITLNLS